MKQIIIYPKCHKSGNRLKVSVYLCVGVKQMDKTFCVCMCVWEREKERDKLLQSSSSLCDPMDCSQPISSVLRILQARILEWVAMPSSRGSSWPRDQNCVSFVSCIWKRFLYQPLRLGSQRPPLKDFKSQIWKMSINSTY